MILETGGGGLEKTLVVAGNTGGNSACDYRGSRVERCWSPVSYNMEESYFNTRKNPFEGPFGWPARWFLSDAWSIVGPASDNSFWPLGPGPVGPCIMIVEQWPGPWPWAPCRALALSGPGPVGPCTASGLPKGPKALKVLLRSPKA